MENFVSLLNGFQVALAPENIAVCLLGAVLGLVVGAMPGIGSLAGCALCSLSVGIMWPGVFSLAAEFCPQGGTAMFGLLALAGDIGCSGGPSVVGSISGMFDNNLKAGLFAAIIFPAALLVMVNLLHKKYRG